MAEPGPGPHGPAGRAGVRVAVIGAGVGGLAAAIRLAAAGARVTVYERAAQVGGKLRRVQLPVAGAAPLSLDAGPSVLTMPHLFEELFAVAGATMRERLPLIPVEPSCRHFFPDGSQLDLFNDPERSRAAIREFGGDAGARGWDRLRAQAARIYEAVRGPFMESPVPTFQDLWHPATLALMPKILQIDPFRTLWAALEDFFPGGGANAKLRVLYGRYATYNGSSPFHCPATLAVIVHVEQEFGIHVVQGGIYRLAEELLSLARGLGVEFRMGAEVERIDTDRGTVRGLVASGERIPVDAVVCNCDALQLHGRLLEGAPGARKAESRIAKIEPSLSAYVVLAAARTRALPLAHHNVYFSSDYPREFAELFDPRRRRPPEDPTVYVCAQDRAPGQPAADDDALERHLILTNAPAVDEARPIDWNQEGPRCRARMVRALNRHRTPILKEPPGEPELAVTPTDFAALFPSSRGSIYGASSNSRMAAFERPANRVPGYRGLYLTGGSAHPGAGLPMVALSGKIASRELIEDFHLAR